MIDTRVSDQDIESLARKLAEFTESLSAGERMAFDMIEQHLVSEANADEMDVSGFGFSGLDTMGADAHREDLLRQADPRRAPENRAGIWQSILSSLTSGGDQRRER
ncbi:MAG: hypothetical protein M3439_02660 [Chloroflexota bacterium]|nr:hypothetical protein [Chloroflexota bacterium]